MCHQERTGRLEGSRSLSQLRPPWAQRVYLGRVCGGEEGLCPVSPPRPFLPSFAILAGPGLGSLCEKRGPSQVLTSPHPAPFGRQMFAFLGAFQIPPEPS